MANVNAIFRFLGFLSANENDRCAIGNMTGDNCRFKRSWEYMSRKMQIWEQRTCKNRKTKCGRKPGVRTNSNIRNVENIRDTKWKVYEPWRSVASLTCLKTLAFPKMYVAPLKSKFQSTRWFGGRQCQLLENTVITQKPSDLRNSFICLPSASFHRASGSGGCPGEFQVGASSISPPFWSGASSTSVQLCSQSSNKSGMMQKIVEKQIDLKADSKLQTITRHLFEMFSKSSPWGSWEPRSVQGWKTQFWWKSSFDAPPPRDPFGSFFCSFSCLERPWDLKAMVWGRIRFRIGSRNKI